MHKKFILIPAAAGYGARIYIQDSERAACNFLKSICKWGNYDKSLHCSDLDDRLLGYEFGDVELKFATRYLTNNGFAQMLLKESKEIFRTYRS